jgi:hypothetical protein
MARLTFSSFTKAAIVGLALPTIIAAATFPYFTLTEGPQDTCLDRSFAMVDLKKANIHDCDSLQSDLKKGDGTYTIGGFDVKDEWMTVGFYQSCTLAFKATRPDDAKNGATWTIGNNDTYNLVIDAVEYGFKDDRGAAEGILPCQYSRGGYEFLYWRVWDSR